MQNEKTVFLTNIPAPYREKVHEFSSAMLNENYTVIYCSQIENNRKWRIEFGSYDKCFLNCKSIQIAGRTIYLTSNIIQTLKEQAPDVIVVGGFSVPMIVAYIWALLKGKNIISFTDANLDSEMRLSLFHKLIRLFFYRASDACIGASKKSLALYRKYGVLQSKLFQSYLCANNELFQGCIKKWHERTYDIIICGQMIEGKMFDFSIDVISKLLEKNTSLKVKVLGAGPLKDHVLQRLDELGVHYDYPGFVTQQELPMHYGDSRVFLFPSMKDAWGVVANEACAAGTPVVTCSIVGAAEELIIDGFNGFVIETSVDLWVSKLELLLDNPSLWQRLSENAKNSVSVYTYENAARGIVDAVNYARCAK